MKRRNLTAQDWKRSAIKGEQLRQRRLAKGKTAKFVADFIDIEPAYLADLEAGKRCLSRRITRLYEKALAK